MCGDIVADALGRVCGVVSRDSCGCVVSRQPALAMTGLFLYFFFCTASHGVLDAMTNGGLGVAFFSPFDTTRYFFPVRPVLVSPIGVSEFFSAYGVRILASEAIWIWLPSSAAFVVLRVVQRIWSAKSVASPFIAIVRSRSSDRPGRQKK